MASGDAVVQVIEALPPETLFATLDVISGNSSPAESVVVHDFDAAAVEYLDIKCRLHGYAGGGLTLRLFWSASSATANETRWGAAIRRIDDGVEDIDVSHTYVFNYVDATAPSSPGPVDYAVITFTDGADMDSWADGEVAIVRITREATHANDDMTGDAELWFITGEET